MRLTLSVDVEIEIEFDYAKDIGTDADMLGRYHMSGPQKHVDKLKAAGAGLKDGDASSSFAGFDSERCFGEERRTGLDHGPLGAFQRQGAHGARCVGVKVCVEGGC